MTWRQFLRTSVTIMLAGLASPSLAQSYDPVPQMFFDNGIMLAITSDIQATVTNDTRVNTSLSDLREISASGDVAQSFRYKTSKARTRANLAQFVAKTRTVNTAEADKMATLIGSVDLVADVSSGMRKMGLDSNNVADAYTLWWVTAWYAVQGRESIADTETFNAVRQQAANAIAARGKFDDASDALRQEMAESLIVQAAIVDEANNQMRGDTKQRRAFATAVNKGARGMGLDLTSMTLTPEGFQPRRGSDAGETIEAADGDDPRALASASPKDVPPAAANDNSATYALLAAAGGAGLAAMFMAGRASGRKG